MKWAHFLFIIAMLSGSVKAQDFDSLEAQNKDYLSRYKEVQKRRRISDKARKEFLKQKKAKEKAQEKLRANYVRNKYQKRSIASDTELIRAEKKHEAKKNRLEMEKQKARHSFLREKKKKESLRRQISSKAQNPIFKIRDERPWSESEM